MEVSYVNHMGDDLMVVNAARVSFNKESEWTFAEYVDGVPIDFTEVLKEGDVKLINYLARNGHWTPFSHPQICLRISAPIFVVRQLYKHKVGFTENEVSRRYVDDSPVFFMPDEWRGRPTNGAKQGSEGSVDMVIERQDGLDEQPYNVDLNEWYKEHVESSLALYNEMIEAGVAPEQARMVLPQSMYTEWYWTGSLSAYARMCKQRLDPHAQKETRDIAVMINDIIQPLFPISWEALTT